MTPAPAHSYARGGHTGIPNVVGDRAASALGFHSEIYEQRWKSTSGMPSISKTRYTVHPIVGSYQPTSQSARLVSGRS